MDGFRFDLMGLLDTDLMNRIQRTLDEKFGEGEKLIYGEPWSARESNMEPGSYPANKENIRRLIPGSVSSVTVPATRSKAMCFTGRNRDLSMAERDWRKISSMQ